MERMFMLALLAVPMIAACGPDDEESYEISSSELTGSVGGEEFTFAGGYAEEKFEGELWIELYSTEVEEPCAYNAFDGTAPHILASAPPEPMDEELGLDHNITFVYDEGGTPQNVVATDGRIVVESVDGETLEGGLIAFMDDNEVDGRFSVPICADDAD